MNLHVLLESNLYWHLPVMILIVSLVYSATRFEPWGAILVETGRWILRMSSFLLGIAVVLYLLASFI
jgi:hypothetical protein